MQSLGKLTFDIVAGVASIAGLVFSGLAWRQAKKASTAAQQARDAVFLRNLAEEFEDVCEKLESVVEWLKTGSLPEAILTASELTAALSELRNRRDDLLTVDARNHMLNAREQLKDLVLVPRGAAIPNNQKIRMISMMHKTSMDLREELGRMKKQLETGANS